MKAAGWKEVIKKLNKYDKSKKAKKEVDIKPKN